MKKVFLLTFSINAGRQRLSLNLLPYSCHLQLHQSLLLLYSLSLVFCFEYLSKTAGPAVLNMELQINMRLMVSAGQTKTRFLSHVTKHFYSSWLLLLCLLLLFWSYPGNTTLSHPRPCFSKWNTLTTSVQFNPCQFPFILLDYLWWAPL